MLAHAIEDSDFANLDAADFIAEWKWDGIRVQAVSGRDERGHIAARLYSRTGEDITKSFPDLLPSLHLPGAIDGELLVLRDGRVQTFNVLQQRLNRKGRFAKTDQGISDPSARLRSARRRRNRSARAAVRRAPRAARGLRQETRRSAHRPVADDRLRQLGGADRGARRSRQRRRRRGCRGRRRRDAEAARRAYLPGRPKGQWWKWKRDPHIIDAVLMYAQRGHGKRSSYYSDYTFGVWTAGEGGDELVPVGKAYFGFTDEELLQIDRFVRRNTTEKFGPVRHVVHEPDQGLVLEVAFEGLAALAAAQIRRRDAVSAHQPAALGQAAARGRPAGDAGADAEDCDSKLRCRTSAWTAIDAHQMRVPHVPCRDLYVRAPPQERPMPNDVRELPASNDGLYRFLGGSPLAVAFRLILLSILVGVVLAAIGFDPWNILHSIQPLVPAALGSRLRRRQLAVALLPARRRDRDPGLAAVAAVRHAARPLDFPQTGAADAIAICRLRRCARLRRPVQHLLPRHRRAASIS